ncbi:prohibitin family protein, partial [Skeletonema marinoi]
QGSWPRCKCPHGRRRYGLRSLQFSLYRGRRSSRRYLQRIIGMKETVYGEGLNFNIPWFERPVVYDIRTRPMVTIGVRVLHRPDPNQLVWLYRHLGKNYDERILPSLMNECAKACVARYNANELLTKRARGFNVVLEDVAITHLSFSPEYAKAVEAKQVAQQDAARAKYIVLGAIQEKRRLLPRLAEKPRVQN